MRKLTILAAMLFGTAAANAAPVVWESDFGAEQFRGDDSIASIGLGFAFPIFGSSHGDVEISNNGIISFAPGTGNSAHISSQDLLAANPRIAVQAFDMVTIVYLNTSVAGRAVFTWVGEEYRTPSSNITTQAQLFADGRMIFGFDGPSVPIRQIMTGISIGGGAADPGGRDLSAGSFSSGDSFYQFFEGGTFDLNQSNLFINPRTGGGFDVSTSASAPTSAVPEPASWALLTFGFGLAGAAMRRRQNRQVPA